jgi:hypothetical protein
MPLAALTIFLGLRTARKSSRPVAAPNAAAEPAAPRTPTEPDQR